MNVGPVIRMAVGPGKKNPKLINIGPMFIPDYRVIWISCIVLQYYNAFALY